MKFGKMEPVAGTTQRIRWWSSLRALVRHSIGAAFETPVLESARFRSQTEFRLKARENAVMRSIRLSFAGAILAVIAVTLSVAGSAFGQGTVIHWFNNNNGYDPIAGMNIDASGN